MEGTMGVGPFIFGTAFGIFVCKTALGGVFGCLLNWSIRLAKFTWNEAGIGIVLGFRFGSWDTTKGLGI